MWINQLRWTDRPCTAISLLALLLGPPTIKAQAVNPMDARSSTSVSGPVLSARLANLPCRARLHLPLSQTLCANGSLDPNKALCKPPMWSTRRLHTTLRGIATYRLRWTMTQLGTFLSPNHGKATPFVGSTWQHLQSSPAGR